MADFAGELRIENIGLRNDGQPYVQADFTKAGRVGSTIGICFYQFDYLVIANQLREQKLRNQGEVPPFDADAVATLFAKISFTKESFEQFVNEINTLWRNVQKK
jgi:hypothetical protein